MMRARRAVSILAALFAAAGAPRAGTLFLGAYPDSVLVFDEGQGRIVDRIPLTTGLPMSMRLSHDRRKIYVITIDHSGVEVIDIATRKVTNHFQLNTATKQYRFYGGAPDPEGKFIYTVATEIEKQADRYEVSK